MYRDYNYHREGEEVREILDGMVIIIGALLFLCGLALLLMHPWLPMIFLGILMLAFIILFGLKWIKSWFVNADFGAKERRVAQTWDAGARHEHGLRAEDEEL